MLENQTHTKRIIVIALVAIVSLIGLSVFAMMPTPDVRAVEDSRPVIIRDAEPGKIERSEPIIIPAHGPETAGQKLRFNIIDDQGIVQHRPLQLPDNVYIRANIPLASCPFLIVGEGTPTPTPKPCAPYLSLGELNNDELYVIVYPRHQVVHAPQGSEMTQVRNTFGFLEDFYGKQIILEDD